MLKRESLQKGVTTIEYALLASLVAIISILAIGDVGDQLVILFNAVVNAFPG
ncbi:Flp family type IVb pilin [Chlorobaculum parvum]|uniref:Flp family type IVb pilin n=1 Tax=Chlorobaculum parvum TaxID=274539 RepID=UPI00059E071A|nr:Flp family type IVb pilin [Chlorobaculum parvum]